MDTLVFRATVVRGVIRPHNTAIVQCWKDRVSQEGPVDVLVTVDKYTGTRSDRANRFWEPLVRRIAKHLGNGFEETREELKARFGVAFVYNAGFNPEIVKSRPGMFFAYNGEYHYLVSTASYTKSEFSDFVDRTIQYAAEIGAPIGDLLD